MDTQQIIKVLLQGVEDGFLGFKSYPSSYTQEDIDLWQYGYRKGQDLSNILAKSHTVSLGDTNESGKSNKLPL